MGAVNVLRDLAAQHRYFRSHPLEAVEYAYARMVLGRHWSEHAAAALAELGIDPAATVGDFERWQPTMRRVVEDGRHWQGWGTGMPYQAGLLLYAIVRDVRPRHVVETGVAAGVSSHGCPHAVGVRPGLAPSSRRWGAGV